jgi:hypothetical protein
MTYDPAPDLQPADFTPPPDPGPPARSATPVVPDPPRPIIERVGMAAIAVVLATLFGGIAALSFVSGELFLGLMAVIGALMTAWVGLLTLLRG